MTANNAAGWGQHGVDKLSLVYSLFDAKQTFDRTDETGSSPYVDYHAWYYTPSSFKLVVFELSVLDLLDWHVDIDFPSECVEFIVSLRRGKLAFDTSAELQAKRLDLLTGIVGDLGEQFAFLKAGLAGANQISRGAEAPTSGVSRNVKVDELLHLIRALDMRQAEVIRCLADQDARIDKIVEVSKMVKRLLRPIRAVGRATRLRRH